MDGASVDGRWYLDVLAFVRATPWLHAPLTIYAEYGLVLFGAFMLLAWWLARRADDATMAAALWVPVATALTLGISDLVKSLLAEPRPCHAIAWVSTLVPCDPPTDWSFPSNHSAIVGAVAFALIRVDRRLAWIAGFAALLMAFSRVYIGAHYPHDVLIGLLLGGVVAALGPLVYRPLVGVLPRLRDSRWATLFIDKSPHVSS